MNPQDSTHQVTWSQVYNDFKDALSGAADALKTGADHVYEILVRQQLINSISMTIFYVIGICVCAAAWTIVIKFTKRKNEEEKGLNSYERGDWGMLYIIPSVFTVLFLFIFSISLKTTIMGYLNPEYGAIMEIKSFIR